MVARSLALLALAALGAAPAHAADVRWSLTFEDQRAGVGARFGLAGESGRDYTGLLARCGARRGEIVVEFELDVDRLPPIAKAISGGDPFPVEIASGAQTVRDLPRLGQSRTGAPWRLIVTVPAASALLNALAESGQLTVASDPGRAGGDRAIDLQFAVEPGREDAARFAQACEREG